jgi:hypothetical protein
MFVAIKWLAEKLKGAGDKSLTDLYNKLDSIETTDIEEGVKTGLHEIVKKFPSLTVTLNLGQSS